MRSSNSAVGTVAGGGGVCGNRRWRLWGRVFGVVRSEQTGRWLCVGRSAGQPRFVLDKLGDFECESQAQAALDAWARRQSARLVVDAPVVAMRQGRLL